MGIPVKNLFGEFALENGDQFTVTQLHSNGDGVFTIGKAFEERQLHPDPR